MIKLYLRNKLENKNSSNKNYQNNILYDKNK